MISKWQWNVQKWRRNEKSVLETHIRLSFACGWWRTSTYLAMQTKSLEKVLPPSYPGIIIQWVYFKKIFQRKKKLFTDEDW